MVASDPAAPASTDASATLATAVTPTSVPSAPLEGLWQTTLRLHNNAITTVKETRRDIILTGGGLVRNEWTWCKPLQLTRHSRMREGRERDHRRRRPRTRSRRQGSVSRSRQRQDLPLSSLSRHGFKAICRNVLLVGNSRHVDRRPDSNKARIGTRRGQWVARSTNARSSRTQNGLARLHLRSFLEASKMSQQPFTIARASTEVSCHRLPTVIWRFLQFSVFFSSSQFKPSARVETGQEEILRAPPTSGQRSHARAPRQRNRINRIGVLHDRC